MTRVPPFPPRLPAALLALVGLSAAVSGVASGPAAADPRRPRDQSYAREMRREGAPPLRAIQQRWRSDMPGYDYIGSDYDAYSGNYRLKFMRGGAVTWIDVDGRTGRELGRSPR